MKGLTAKQQAIHELKLGGKKNAEIASLLGISVPVVCKTVVVINKKLGIKTVPGAAHQLENANPEKAAAILDAMTEVDPYMKVKEAFAACGLPAVVSSSLMKRLRQKYTGALTEVRSLKTGEILDIINKKIHLASFYLDDKAMADRLSKGGGPGRFVGRCRDRAKTSGQNVPYGAAEILVIEYNKGRNGKNRLPTWT